MSTLTFFGLAAVTAMMLFYAFEGHGRAFTFAFGMACLAASAYGWLAGTWPFGIVEAIWAAVAFNRWYHRQSSVASSSLP